MKMIRQRLEKIRGFVYKKSQRKNNWRVAKSQRKPKYTEKQRKQKKVNGQK